MAAPLTPQQQLLQQQQAMERADQRQGYQADQGVGQQAQGAKKRMNSEKPKPKRPRKTKKADGPEAPPKKKRVTKKKTTDSSPADANESF